jgi:hypothetical protein
VLNKRNCPCNLQYRHSVNQSMKRVNTETLKKGDIILTTGDSTDSKIVRAGTFSDISHAMLCVGRGSVMDSTSEGVHARNIEKMLYEDSWPMYVLRLNNEISDEKLDSVISYVRSTTGTTYSLVEAGAAATPGWFKKSRKQFCSRLVAEAYASVGVKLYKNPPYCSPANLKQSALLHEVNGAIVPATDEEQLELRQQGDATVGMREITNILLDEVRTLVHVESLNDVDVAVLRQPLLDSRICDVYRRSGYCTYCEVDPARFPWRYNITEIVRFFHSLDNSDPRKIELLAECRATLKDHENGVFDHWYRSLNGYRQRRNQHPNIKLFALLATLYERLVELHQLRLQTAQVFVRWHEDTFPNGMPSP